MNHRSGPDASLVERLREQYGSEVDPGISLGPATKLEPLPTTSAPSAFPSSGVLSRLESRASVASRYRLEGEIARGGMGAILEVWDEDLRRHLAMKVALSSAGEGSASKPENLDARVLARFLEEAQVTGQLDHPGIVPVHELGLDENGQLYFTMPLVRGRDLEHIFSLVPTGEEGWSLTRALGVILKACEAMAYAHDKGVIHRDLKPANVMVGRFGEVYVMDWGLARIRGHEDRHDCRVAPSAKTEEAPMEVDPREDLSGENSGSLYTMDGDVIGTPAYMAPEQARGQLDALDERADVYSLGAMLYRLLAGSSPYVKPGETRGGYEILTDLLEGSPLRIDDLAPDIPMELVAICDKAMARAAADRYANMLEFAEDLRAYLENRVVHAYETGAVAEARKWVRRNKPLAVSLAAGFLALIGGLAASLVLKGQADASAELAENRRVEAVQSATVAEEQRAVADEQRELAFEQKQVAEAQREKADLNADLALESQLAAEASALEAKRESRITAEVNRFVNEDLLSAAGIQGLGKDVTVYQILKLASVDLNSRFREDPAVAAALHLTLAESLENLGDYKLALSHAKRSLSLFEESLGEKSEYGIRSLRAVAASLGALGESQASIEAYERALANSRELLGPRHDASTTTLNDLAAIYSDVGDLAKARSLYEKALEIVAENGEPLDAEYAVMIGNYGTLLEQLGEFEESVKLQGEALEIHRKANGSKHPNTLHMMVNLSVVYLNQGDLRAAEKLLRKATKDLPKVLGEDHPETARSLGNLGVLYIAQGRDRKAQPILEDALEKLRSAYGEEHFETLRAQHNLAASYAGQGMLKEALELREPTLEAQRRVLGDRHPITMNSMNSLAVLYRDLSRYDDSAALYREVLDLRTEVLGADHPDTLVTLENYGGLLFSTEDYQGSLEFTSKVLESRIRVLGPDSLGVAKTTHNLGMIKDATGDPVGALGLFEDALIRARGAVGDLHPTVAECLYQIGEVNLGEKEYQACIEPYREAIKIRKQITSNEEDLYYMMHQLGYALYKTEQYEEAASLLRETFEARLLLLGEEDRGTLATEIVLSNALFKLGRFEEAEPYAIDFYERKLKVMGPDHSETAMGTKLLKEIAEARNQ